MQVVGVELLALERHRRGGGEDGLLRGHHLARSGFLAQFSCFAGLCRNHFLNLLLVKQVLIVVVAVADEMGIRLVRTHRGERRGGRSLGSGAADGRTA